MHERTLAELEASTDPRDRAVALERRRVLDILEQHADSMPGLYHRLANMVRNGIDPEGPEI